ncbi:MAG TPA: hypothetical protein PLS10_11745 [Chitinophagales bacterium]|nr:hypothetical protein [Chitinophagales bacterium]
MKYFSKIKLLIVSFPLLLYSCTFEGNQPEPSVLNGKVRFIYNTDNNGNDTNSRYYLYYDATGFLTAVKDDSITVFAFTKLNDTTINVIFHLPNEPIANGIVRLNGNRVISIGRYDHFSYPDLGIDTIIYTELIQTVYSSANQLDSIYNNVGYFAFEYITNIKAFDFTFITNNCTNYKSSWTQTSVYGWPVYQKSAEIIFTYSDLINDYKVPNHIIPFTFQYTFGMLPYFLGLNGCFIIEPNKNLIQNYTSINSSSSDTYDYNYSLTNGKVTSYKVSTRNSVGHIEYYE